MANLSQAAVAKALGIDRSTYARQEANGNIKLETAIRLAQIFGVSVEKLTGEPEQMGNDRLHDNTVPEQLSRTDALILTNNETNIIKMFRSLTAENKKLVQDFIKKKYEE